MNKYERELKKATKELKENLEKLSQCESLDDISIPTLIAAISSAASTIWNIWEKVKPVALAGAFVGIFFAWWQAMRWLIEKLYAFLLPSPPVTYEKAMEAGARFIAISATLTTIPMMIRVIFAGKSREEARRADTIAKAFELPYWTLGLGFLGWQVMAIPLEFAIREPLRSEFMKRYGTRTMPRTTMERLYRLDLISEKELVEYYVRYGYPDEDIKKMVIDQRIRKYRDILESLKKEREKYVDLLAKARREEKVRA